MIDIATIVAIWLAFIASSSACCVSMALADTMVFLTTAALPDLASKKSLSQ